MKNKQNVLLADCDETVVLPLVDTLRVKEKPFVIKSHIANWKRTGMLSELMRYGMYFVVGFYYFLRRKSLDAVVGWQQFYALIFCFFCNLFSVKKTNTTVALNFTYKAKRGKKGMLYRWFMGKCVSSKYLDYIHVLSPEYAEKIQEEFCFPKERILVTPFGVEDKYAKMRQLDRPEKFQGESYALAIGRSNRDFDFLIRAWKTIDFPLVIISDTYKGNALCDNILLLNNVAGKESLPWIANCDLMIIPILEGSICSGDTVLLTAMSIEKKVIITKPSVLAQMYVKDGENAVLAPKNEEVFRKIVTDVLHDEKYCYLGQRARETFLENYTLSSMGARLTQRLRDLVE